MRAFKAAGFSWWSNEFWYMTDEGAQAKLIAGCPSVNQDGFEHLNLELLQLLQQYQ